MVRGRRPGRSEFGRPSSSHIICTRVPEREAEGRDHRRRVQPAAGRRGGHQIAEPVGDRDVAGVAARLAGARDRRLCRGRVADGVGPAADRKRRQARRATVRRPRPQLAGRRVARRAIGRESAYAAERSASSGTSGSSPYQASRSANASFAHSTTVWTKSAVPGRRSNPSSSASCWSSVGPWLHAPGLHTVQPRKSSVAGGSYEGRHAARSSPVSTPGVPRAGGVPQRRPHEGVDLRRDEPGRPRPQRVVELGLAVRRRGLGLTRPAAPASAPTPGCAASHRRRARSRRTSATRRGTGRRPRRSSRRIDGSTGTPVAA